MRGPDTEALNAALYAATGWHYVPFNGWIRSDGAWVELWKEPGGGSSWYGGNAKSRNRPGDLPNRIGPRDTSAEAIAAVNDEWPLPGTR